MDSRVKLFGHPIHQMLIVFPLGLLGMAVIFDLVHLGVAGAWSIASWYMIAAGIVSGLIAAVFGLIDWLGIPSATRAKKIGLLHAAGNVIVIVLFLIAWLIRRGDPNTSTGLALVLEVCALALSLVTGWLGGELVDRLGVGVDAGAHLDAPSSLKGPIPRGL